MLKRISIIGVIILALGFIIWGMFFVKFAEEQNSTTTKQIPDDFDYIIVVQDFKNLKMGLQRWGINSRVEKDPKIKTVLPWYNIIDSVFSHEDCPLALDNIKIVKHGQHFTLLSASNLPSYTQSQMTDYLSDQIKLKTQENVINIYNKNIYFGVVKGIFYFSSDADFESRKSLSQESAQNIKQKITAESNKNAAFNIISKDHALTTKTLLSTNFELFDVYFKNNGIHLSGWIEKDTKSLQKARHNVFQFAPYSVDFVHSITLSNYKIRSTFKGASLEYYNWIGDEMSIMAFESDTVYFVSVKDQTDAALSLEEANLKSSSISNPDSLKYEAYNNYKFYRNYAAPKYKTAFSGFINQNVTTPAWYYTSENYVIFSKTITGLKKYMDLISKGEILSEQPQFSKIYNKYSVEEASISSYDRTYTNIENDPVMDVISNGQKFSTYTKIGKKTIVANIFMQQEEMTTATVSSSKRDTLWQLQIPGLSKIVKSQWFYNHREQLYNILLVDDQNQLYAVNENGVLKWKKKILQAINSDFTLVDLYQNNKQQLLFTTKNKIHVLDILGREVNNFPYQTPAPITSPVSVLDYKNDGDFRIFAGLQNGQIVNVNKEGNAVEGWSFTTGKAAIISPLIQTQFNNYDYLHFVDAKGNLYAVGRRGEDRLNAKVQFPNFQNQGLEFHKGSSWQSSHYSYLNRNAWLYNAYINTSYDSLQFETKGPVKVWEYDFMNSNDNYWLTTTKGYISVFNKLGIKTFEFATNVSAIRFIEPAKVNGNINIAFLDGNDKKVYLLDKHGEIVEGYPKKGNQFLSVLDQSSAKNVIFLTIQNDRLICLPL